MAHPGMLTWHGKRDIVREHETGALLTPALLLERSSPSGEKIMGGNGPHKPGHTTVCPSSALRLAYTKRNSDCWSRNNFIRYLFCCCIFFSARQTVAEESISTRGVCCFLLMNPAAFLTWKMYPAKARAATTTSTHTHIYIYKASCKRVSGIFSHTIDG